VPFLPVVQKIRTEMLVGRDGAVDVGFDFALASLPAALEVAIVMRCVRAV